MNTKHQQYWAGWMVSAHVRCQSAESARWLNKEMTNLPYGRVFAVFVGGEAFSLVGGTKPTSHNRRENGNTTG